MNKRSVEGMNRMSVSEQLTYFFEGIEMVIGKKEKKALQAVVLHIKYCFILHIK